MTQRKSAPFDVDATIKNLLSEAAGLGMVPHGTRDRRIALSVTRAYNVEHTPKVYTDDEVLAFARDPKKKLPKWKRPTLTEAATLPAELPDAVRRRLAVARALAQLEDAARGAALPAAVLQLAKVSHAAAAPLRGLVETLAGARAHVERTLAEEDARYDEAGQLASERGIDWTPPPKDHMRVPHDHEVLCEIPGALVANLEEAVQCALALDAQLRQRLGDPRARQARGSKLDSLLVAVTQHLRWGGFTAPEVAKLVVDGGGEAPKQALKRVYERFEIAEDHRRYWDPVRGPKPGRKRISGNG